MQDHAMAPDIGLPPQERLLKPALLKGWRRRCPNCGSGPLLKGYLKVRDTCPVCHEDLTPNAPMTARPISPS